MIHQTQFIKGRVEKNRRWRQQLILHFEGRLQILSGKRNTQHNKIKMKTSFIFFYIHKQPGELSSNTRFHLIYIIARQREMYVDRMPPPHARIKMSACRLRGYAGEEAWPASPISIHSSDSLGHPPASENPRLPRENLEIKDKHQCGTTTNAACGFLKRKSC